MKIYFVSSGLPKSLASIKNAGQKPDTSNDYQMDATPTWTTLDRESDSSTFLGLRLMDCGVVIDSRQRIVE